MAKYQNGQESNAIIQNWMRQRNVLEFLELWEELNNSTFDSKRANALIQNSGANTFVMSPKKWIDNTGAIGITSKSGRGGGTYASSDIAFNFASWISPAFQLYVAEDYKRQF